MNVLQYLTTFPAPPTAVQSMTDVDGNPLQVGDRISTAKLGAAIIQEMKEPDNLDGYGASAVIRDEQGEAHLVRLHAAQARALPQGFPVERPTLVP